MDNIAIYIALFIVLFFSVSSVENNRISEVYSKIPTLDAMSSESLSSIASPETVAANLFKEKDSATEDIKITSIDKTVTTQKNTDGLYSKKLSLYIIFKNPTLKKEGDQWRMKVKIDATTKGAHGENTKFLNGKSLQIIDSKLSYKLDSGAFVFNIDLPIDQLGTYSTNFIVTDMFSNKKDAHVVSIKL